jgi:DNA-binding winged helix-turn-helix (wHTH) protein
LNFARVANFRCHAQASSVLGKRGAQNELLDGFRLQELRIEPLTGFVRGNDQEFRLPSKRIEVLMCLARNPGKLVPRGELLQRVWGSADTSKESLSHSISEIRHALGDRTEHPPVMQAFHKRGCRTTCSDPTILNLDS